MSQVIATAIGVALALGLLWAASGPFRSHANWMYFEQDDFFYYLKVAQNFAAGHGSTFNRIVPTNGYHPLWMLLIASVVWMGAGPHGILLFLALSVWVASIATYLLSMLLLRHTGVSIVANSAISAFIAVYCAHICFACMEVTLTVPLTFLLLLAVRSFAWTHSGMTGWLYSVALGLIASAVILSRLDTVIFIALLATGFASEPSLRRRIHWRHVLGLGFGVMPVVAYLCVNRLVFDVWMPVSGMSKQLKLDRGFTSKAWTALAQLSHSQWAGIGLILLALLALPWLWKRIPAVERAFVLPTLLFPFLYTAILSWLSDWYLWGWYFYSLRAALCVAFLVGLRSPRLLRLASWTPAVALFAVGTLIRIQALSWEPQIPAITESAADLKTFATTHPGIYAMGDRSGAHAYLLPYPVVQTEGLVMDRAFLQLIANQVPLRDVLARYHVRYYVGTAMVPYTGCFQAVEPWQAGPHAPHMRAQFCEPPVARWKNREFETVVFDLQPAL